MREEALVLEIPGVPIPKARARFVKCGDRIMSYDIQSNEKKSIQRLIKFATLAQNKWGSTYPLCMEIDCYFRPPNSSNKQLLNLHSWKLLFHTKKPDCTNLAKFYEDALNEIVFHDDRQLISVSVNKFYGNEEKTVIRIMPKITYDEVLNEFLELINIQDFCKLSKNIYDLTLALESMNENVSEETRMEIIKSALLTLRNLAYKYGKPITDIAKKHKNFINKIEK